MNRRLVFVCNNLNIGGPQKGLIALLDRLDPQQFTCTIVSLQPGGSLRPYIAERFRVLDVPSFALSLQVNRKTVARDLRTLARHRALMSMLMYAVAIVAASIGHPVNPWRQRVWYYSRNSLLGVNETFDAAFAVSSGVSTYYMVDSIQSPRKYHWVISDYSRTKIARRVDLHYFNQTKGGLAVSPECSQIFRELFPELETPPPIPFKFQVPWRYYSRNEGAGVPEYDGHNGARILTVTRLERGKGLPLALAAARGLLDRGVSFRWLILGDGDQRPKLEAQIVELSLGNSVQICGFKNNVSEYLKACDVFVLPSSSEGRSTAVDEAIACGAIPVITDYKTARSQVTDGVTGFVSGFTATALADCIVRALEPTVRESLGSDPNAPSENDPTPFFMDLSS